MNEEFNIKIVLSEVRDLLLQDYEQLKCNGNVSKLQNIGKAISIIEDCIEEKIVKLVK